MFDQYQYIDSVKAVVPEVEAIHRITGVRSLEEPLQNIRSLKSFMLMVEDDDDGFLNLEGKNADNGFRTFYIVGRVKINDTNSRKEVQKKCKLFALKIFKQMMADAQNFGDACYGFDRSRIDYRRIGPLIENYHGFAFSYIMIDENFNLA